MINASNYNVLTYQLYTVFHMHIHGNGSYKNFDSNRGENKRLCGNNNGQIISSINMFSITDTKFYYQIC